MLGDAPVESNHVYFKLFLSKHLNSVNIAALQGTGNQPQVVPSSTML